MHLGGLDMALTKYKLGQLIQLEDERNSDNKYTLDDVKGIYVCRNVCLDFCSITNPSFLGSILICTLITFLINKKTKMI